MLITMQKDKIVANTSIYCACNGQFNICSQRDDDHTLDGCKLSGRHTYSIHSLAACMLLNYFSFLYRKVDLKY